MKQEYHNHFNQIAGKMREYESLYQNLEDNYNNILTADVEMKQKSNVLELQAR